MRLRFTAQGKGKYAECTEFRLTDSFGQLSLSAKGTISAENSIKQPYFYGTIDQAEISPQGSARLFQNLTGKAELPSLLTRIGFIHFTGDVSGYPHQLTTHGNLGSRMSGTCKPMLLFSTDSKHNITRRLNAVKLPCTYIASKFSVWQS